MFLEPLSHVVGAAKSKDLLQQLARSPQQQNRLQLLGCLLGVQEWTRSFERRCQPSEQCLEFMDEAGAEDVQLIDAEVNFGFISPSGSLGCVDHHHVGPS